MAKQLDTIQLSYERRQKYIHFLIYNRKAYVQHFDQYFDGAFTDIQQGEPSNEK